MRARFITALVDCLGIPIAKRLVRRVIAQCTDTLMGLFGCSVNPSASPFYVW